MSVAAPPAAFLTRGRPVAQAIVRGWWELEARGADRFPRRGGVVLAANHVGWLDGPLLAICSPRPVHALTKQEMFEGALGAFLRSVGQIPLDRGHVDLRAIRTAIATLEQGGVVGVFPEGARGAGEMTSPRAGAAYLAMVTGAPVVPVSFLGTRLPGGSDGSLPPRGSRVVMSFGEPVRIDQRPWPRTTVAVAEAALGVAAGVIETMREAERTTGMKLPGPLAPRQQKNQKKK